MVQFAGFVNQQKTHSNSNSSRACVQTCMLVFTSTSKNLESG